MPISQGAGAIPGLYSHIAQSQDRDSASLPKPFKSARGCAGKKSKGKTKPQQQPPPPPPPPEQEEQYEDTTTMRIIEATIEAAYPTGANIVVENYIDVLNKGEEDNKIIIEFNTKATTDNLIPPVVAIIIIIMAIIKAEVAVAVVVTIIDHAVMEKAITEAITIINDISITCMMMDPSLNNMIHHALFAEVSIISLNIVLRENMTLLILWRK